MRCVLLILVMAVSSGLFWVANSRQHTVNSEQWMVNSEQCAVNSEQCAVCGPVRVKVGVKDNQTTNTQVTAIMRDVGLRNYGEFNEPVFCNEDRITAQQRWCSRTTR